MPRWNINKSTSLHTAKTIKEQNMKTRRARHGPGRMVAVSLFVRSHQDAEEAEGREQTDDHQAARQEDNQVIDYHLWDRR